MRDKVFIDTNVLVYAHDDASPAKRDRAREIVRLSITSGTGVVSTQVLSEFYVTVTRTMARPLAIPAARREVRMLAAMEVVEIDIATIDLAIELQERCQIGYWDGLILAAAAKSGCAVVLSEDLCHGQSYGDVTVRNPFGPAS